MEAAGRRLKTLASLFILAWAVAPARAEDFSLFEKKIRPLLIDKCYSCHSADAKKLKGELLLDSRQGVIKGGKNGGVLVPGDPDHSRLIEAVRWSNEDLKMPPKERLTDEQVADLVAWVKQGAPDPRGAATAAPSSGIDFAAARSQWAYHAPADPAIPQVKRQGWCKSPIDQFILARLEEKGLNPAPPAAKRALVRRAYFDLIGLPPTPQEVDAFIHDEAPDAFARVVDHLLASPHYGERWARHWLDVVRYTDSFDSRGVASAGDCTDAWRYRDWVVNAFNRDLPYDQFITQQVAGDLLDSKQEGGNHDGTIATTMYVIGNWPGGDADRKKMLTDIVDDQVDVTGRAFLGLTLACARCHDHKFDPIPTADYYGMAGIFFSSHFMPGEGSPTSGGPLLHFSLASPEQIEKQKQYDNSVVALKKKIRDFTDAALAVEARKALPDVDRYLSAAVEVSQKAAAADKQAVAKLAQERKLNPAFLAGWIGYLKPYLADTLPHTALSVPRHNAAGVEGLDGWFVPSGTTPNLVVNRNDRLISYETITLPPKSVAAHPGPKSGVAVGWRSPVSGAVRIRGRVIDADDHCGNGINWAIDHIDARVSHAIAHGTFANGSRQAFESGEGGGALDAVNVKAGQFVQLAIYPNGEYSCDTTVIELEIAEQGGANRVWNLARDLVPDALAGGKGNPHADSFGNHDVWEFYEVPDAAAGSEPTTFAGLSAWANAAKGPNPQSADALGAALRQALVTLDAEAEKLAKDGKDLASLSGADAAFYRQILSGKGPLGGPAQTGAVQLPPDARQDVAKIQQELKALEKSPLPPLPVCEGMSEGGVPNSMYAGIADTRIHIRGRYDRQSDLVPRHFPRLLAGEQQPAISQGSGRLELARFLSSPQNPLTARVMMNRLWQHHFDEGIVRTPNNYGKLGRPPTHPELLDWLALKFIRQGWSVKAMQREMMLSAAYQQSSLPDPATLKADPDDLLFGWVRRRRLEAEAIRDSLLAHSGKLDESAGGPAVRDANTRRRTLYLMTIRSDRSDYRTLFDAADASAIVDQRIDSIVAPQALFLLNNTFVLDQAKGIAERVLGENMPDDSARIDWLYQHLFSRPATDKEMAIGAELLKQSQAGDAQNPPLSREAAWGAYCQVMVCANEFVYLD